MTESQKLKFVRIAGTCTYRVYDGEKLIGRVEKSEGWTVRGRPITWKASNCGKTIGRRQETRAAAAALLVLSVGTRSVSAD